MRSLACGCACAVRFVAAALLLLLWACPAAAAAASPRRKASSASLPAVPAAPHSSSSSRQRFFARTANRRCRGSSGESEEETTPLLLSSLPQLLVPQRRGGGAPSCAADSDLQLALKVTVSSAAETGGLVLLLWGAQQLSNNKCVHRFLCRSVRGLPVLQWCSLFLTVFGSSAVQSVLDGTLSVASNQALRPSAIPGAAASWYAALQKPWFNPPGWLFPVMWLIVSKPTQLWGVSRILKLLHNNNNINQQQAAPSEASTSNTAANVWPALAVYCGHLALGDAWNQVFFGCRRIRLGARVIGAFWCALAASAAGFGRLDPAAGRLLLPTLGWVTVAAALNGEIGRLNPEK